jgi:hypothetical protein
VVLILESKKIVNNIQYIKVLKKIKMDQPPLDETKQPSPPPSTETTTTLTTTSDAYLSTHLIVPYFITAGGEIKRPEHLIAWWSRIFSFYGPDEKDRIELRFLCRLFRDALKSPPSLWTSFPHPNYSTLNKLIKKLNKAYQTNPNKAPKIVLVMNGTFCGAVGGQTLIVKYPMIIIGAGQNKTYLSGYGFQIEGKKGKGKKVVVKNMTVSGSKSYGIHGYDGLSWLCEDMTITQCGLHGVVATNTKGRLINCVITQCRGGGIYCEGNALIEMKGEQTNVDGNVTGGSSFDYGLTTYNTSSRIHLLFPLTKESISTNNHSGQNYGGFGTIDTVAAFSE